MLILINLKTKNKYFYFIQLLIKNIAMVIMSCHRFFITLLGLRLLSSNVFINVCYEIIYIHRVDFIIFNLLLHAIERHNCIIRLVIITRETLCLINKHCIAIKYVYIIEKCVGKIFKFIISGKRGEPCEI